jgi:hypothetical protein
MPDQLIRGGPSWVVIGTSLALFGCELVAGIDDRSRADGGAANGGNRGGAGGGSGAGGTGGMIASGTGGGSGAGGTGGTLASGTGGGSGTGGSSSGAGGSSSGAAGTGGATGSGGRGGAAGTSAAGAAGTSGTAGNGGRGGAAGTSAAGAAGTSGTAGIGGRGGAAGTSAAGAAGTSGAAGNGGRGGAGGGGTTGTAGTTAAAGRGGTTGAGGTGGQSTGCAGPGVFCEDFEDATIGANMVAGWTRNGGASLDWTVITDGTRAFAQDAATSATLRFMAASGGSPPAPWSGSITAAARVKLLLAGSSNQTAWVCPRYVDTSNYYCVGLLLSGGVQIRAVVGGNVSSSPTFTVSVQLNTWYRVELRVDAAGMLRASINGLEVGTFTPPETLAAGTVAVGTASVQAAFDDIVVTQP